MRQVLLLAGLALAAGPDEWLHEAFHGRRGSAWSGVAVVERPGRAPDTARVCREGTSERLDFPDRSLILSGDSTVRLDHERRTAHVGPRRLPPPPPPGGWKVVGREATLGREALVLEGPGPGNAGRLKVWIDTSLPVVLRTSMDPAFPPPGPHQGPPPPPLRQILSIQPAHGCPPGSFAVPEGYQVRRGATSRRDDSLHRDGPMRHEVASAAELASVVGFAPPAPAWLPAGFVPRDWAWVETPSSGKAAQILYGNGTQSVSVFWRRGQEPPPYCPEGGCKDARGRVVVFHRSGGLNLAVTGEVPPEMLERIAGLRK